MNKYTSTGKNLIKLFDEDLHNFKKSTRRHYAERLYRISGEAKYTEYLTGYFEEKESKIKTLINDIDDSKAITKHGIRITKNSFKKDRGERINKRLDGYIKIPEYKYYQDLIWFINKIDESKQLDNYFTIKEYKIFINKLKKVDFKQYLNNEEIIFLDPVQTVNFVFYLRNLKILNYIDEYIALINKVFKDYDQNPEMFSNLLYAYTHIIISESRYYQKYIYHSKLNWILEFFDDNIEKILGLPNKDLVAEIGVCYKLIKSYKSKNLKIIKDHILSKMTNGVLYKKEATELQKVEHRNVLSIILLVNIPKFYKGPFL